MDESSVLLLKNVSLPHLCEDYRFCALDKYDAYYANTQYNHLQYDWNGFWDGYGDQADIAPGWYVPLKRRKPSIKVQMTKLIVGRLTSMLLGEDRFPSINIPGDDEAEDYTRALIQSSKFGIKLVEARNKGGTCGTAVMSFAFVDGKPRLDVHRAKHIRVLSWKDRYEFRPSVVLKCYRYVKSEFDSSGKPKKNTYYYVRMWTEDTETIWDPIPEALAKNGQWIGVKSYSVTHGYGDCPVYWAQNLPDSDQEDGLSDVDGLCDDFDELNRLMSATTKGTVANVDPTLVIKDDPGNNSGALKKGSENAIYSKGGADYLELTGTSIETAMKLVRQLIEYDANVAQVILPNPENLSGASKSAAALRLLYQPMTNRCDDLRAQYGDGLAVPILTGMLRAARKVSNQGGGEIFVTLDGRRIQEKPVIILPPRVTKTLEYEVDTEGESLGEPKETITIEQRTPGTGENIDLKWPAYFKPTQQDISAGVDAATKARGTLVSDKTATKFIANDFGVQDVDAEITQIEEDNKRRAEALPGPEDEEFDTDSSKNKDEEDNAV